MGAKLGSRLKQKRKNPGSSGSLNRAWKGGRTVTVNGYVLAHAPGHPKAMRGGNYVYEHVLVAERAVGYVLPDGVQVHHRDRDRRNNANANLIVCENQAYHRLLHRRERVYRAGGRPGKDQICQRCKQMLAVEAFPRYHKSPTGRGNMCSACANMRRRKINLPPVAEVLAQHAERLRARGWLPEVVEVGA